MRCSRTPSRISESLHQRLSSYALAASAAGVGTLALIPPAEFALPASVAVASLSAFSESAEAKVVYTPVHKDIVCDHYKIRSMCTGTLRLDLNHDDRRDFRLEAVADIGDSGGLRVLPANSENQVWKTSSRLVWAEALPLGAVIRSARNFQAKWAWMFNWDETSTLFFSGPWANVSNRYLGLKFVINGKMHYGWARLTTYPGLNRYATLTGYAYETIPNKPIIAGKTHGPDVITLEPASLGHLAQGSSGVAAWRKRNERK
jgi:hypothetical protein